MLNSSLKCNIESERVVSCGKVSSGVSYLSSLFATWKGEELQILIFQF